MNHVFDGIFTFQQDAYCIHQRPTAMVQNTHLPFFLGYDPKTVQSLNPMMVSFREPHSSNSMSYE